MQIGSANQSYSVSSCTGNPQNYSVTIASSAGQLQLVNKRLRLTASLVYGAPTIYLNSNTYLTTPPYYVCSLRGQPGDNPGGSAGPGGKGSGSGAGSGAIPPVKPTTITVGTQGEAPDSTNTVLYISSDHLGSVSLVTNSSGQAAGVQEFDPWGQVRTGGTVGTQTRLNFTGQKLDDTGLLDYNARMYDPLVGRFVSPDSIVPGAASGVGGAGGSVGQEQNSKLTVDFHESGFLSAVQDENSQTLYKGFWFQLSNEDKQRARQPWGPTEPQALARYAYTLNNPIRYVDPTGHMQVSGISGGIRIGLNYEELGLVIEAIATGGLEAGVEELTKILSKILVKQLAKVLAEGIVESFANIIGEIGVKGLLDLLKSGQHLEIDIYFLEPWKSRVFFAQGTEPPANVQDVVPSTEDPCHSAARFKIPGCRDYVPPTNYYAPLAPCVPGLPQLGLCGAVYGPPGQPGQPPSSTQ